MIIEKLTLFLSKANQYEGSVLTNTNCRGNINKKLLSHLAGCLSESTKERKFVLQNTNKELLSHLAGFDKGMQCLSESIKKGKFVMATNLQI